MNSRPRAASRGDCMRALAGFLVSLVLASPALAKDPRRAPLRLSSEGDSITAAIDAEELHPWEGLTPNEWASWANGYHDRLERLLGRTDVDSHNQRISKQFGKKKRKNYMEAFAGADSTDLLAQALRSVKHKADYVTVFMGHNDVCTKDFAGIPSDTEFESNVRAGFDALRAGLPPGATVYTVGIVDVFRLWQIGDQLEALGILDCKRIWEDSRLQLTPCGTMFGANLDAADREYTRGRILAFNAILARLVAEYDARDAHHWWQYTNVAFETPFEAEDLSPFDCFHPSARGQKRLSAETWADGPFAP